MTPTTRSRRATYAVCVVLVMAIILFILMDAPKMSKDPQIRSLQKEAIELRIFERAREVRYDGKALFEWYWTYDGEKKFTENNVTFRGTNGYHEIEYQNLTIKWRDWTYMKVFFNGSKVYEAKIKYNYILGGGSKNLDEITAFITGPWIDVFDEMYIQAIKGPPSREAEELKENWGIG